MPEARSVYLSTAYLAPVEYYLQMNSHPQVVVERHCNYMKQTYRNRCIISSANGLQVLSIPVERFDSLKCPTQDIRIAEHGNWQHLHWNALVSAYNSTAFFEYYQDDFRPFYNKRYPFLFDFNEQLRDLICTLLDISPTVSYSPSYRDVDTVAIDLRGLIHPKKTATVPEFKPYYQVFETKFGFQPNLSIVDLLFNMGPESVLFLS